jgi:hypothetical protein
MNPCPITLLSIHISQNLVSSRNALRERRSIISKGKLP